MVSAGPTQGRTYDTISVARHPLLLSGRSSLRVSNSNMVKPIRHLSKGPLQGLSTLRTLDTTLVTSPRFKWAPLVSSSIQWSSNTICLQTAHATVPKRKRSTLTLECVHECCREYQTTCKLILYILVDRRTFGWHPTAAASMTRSPTSTTQNCPLPG